VQDAGIGRQDLQGAASGPVPSIHGPRRWFHLCGRIRWRPGPEQPGRVNALVRAGDRGLGRDVDATVVCRAKLRV
jgi:hypothetical protein